MKYDRTMSSLFNAALAARLVPTFLAVICFLYVAPGLAENERRPDTIDEITASKTAAEENQALDENTRKRVVEAYTQALAAQRQREDLAHERRELEKTINTAPQQIKRIKKRLSSGVPANLRLKIPQKATLEELEKLAQQAAIQLNSLQETARQKEQALAHWNDTRRQLRSLIGEQNARIQKLQQDISALPIEGEEKILGTARKAALRAQLAQRESELTLYDLQLSSEKLLSELFSDESRLANAEVSWLEAQLFELNQQIEKLRQAHGTQVVAEAQQEKQQLRNAPRPVVALAEQNIHLSEELNQVIRTDAENMAELRRLRQDIKNLVNGEKSVRSRLELFGATDAMGRMLRKKLEAVRSIKRTSNPRSNEETMNHLTDRQIDIDTRLESLLDIKQRARALMAEIPASELSRSDSEAVEQDITRLLEKQKQLLESLADAYQQASARLLELSTAEAEYARTSADFEAFIRGKLFWIRNTTPVNFKHLKEKMKSATTMLSPTRLRNSLNDIQHGFRQNPILPISGLLLGLLMLLSQPLANHKIAALGQTAAHLKTNRYYHTLQAIYFTAIRSAGWPVLLGFTGWWLGRIPSAEPYTTALSEGLYTTATVLFTVAFLRQVCRPDGLAHRHFHWPNSIRRKLWTELRWLKYATAPLSFLIAFTLAVEFTPLIPAIGRPALIVMMFGLMVFTYRMLNANSPISTYLQLKRPRNWLTQTRFLWFPIVMLTPLSLAVLSILGYHYTAGLLTQRLLYTIWLMLLLLLAKDLFLRWIFIEKRRIAYAEALKRRAERRAEQNDANTEECDSEIVRLEEEDSVEFYEHLSDQAQHIIGTLLLIAGIAGFWAIWSDLLPALKFLESIKLPFSTTELVDGIATEVPVTLADIGIGMLVAAITIMAARNIPGLLEILLLQRLPIDAGARYAITTLSQYFIVAVGITAAFSIIGTQWSSIQWLVAALSVGLGFGLQEIVANFVSGIILLFERPIRVGDVVTIGETTGTVSRIRIRATTIRDWERQELLVPNKEFVTGRLLNWTLSDPINRITIDVGIAYGADVTLALKLLAEAAKEHPRVLDDPEPLITFDQFGDSALNLRMRCYLDSMEFRTRTRSEVNEAINRKFNEAGIVIAFPQTDVHLDTNAPLSVRIERPRSGAS